jgi:hypothetical protein
MGAAGTIKEKWLSDEKYHYWINKVGRCCKKNPAYVEISIKLLREVLGTPQQKIAIYGVDTDWGSKHTGLS